MKTWFICCMGLLLCALAAQAQGTGDIATFDVSPDARQIVFSAKGQGLSDLYLLNVKSHRVQRLTQTDVCEIYPRFSPDGQWITYSGSPGGALTSHIYLRSLDGKVARQLTVDNTALDFMPSFSPDGSMIVFSRETGQTVEALDAGRGDVYTVAVDGHQLRRVTKQNYPSRADPNFFSDSSHIIYTVETRTGTHFYLADKGGQHPPRALFRQSPNAASSRVHEVGEFEYLPDRKLILFTEQVKGTEEYELWTMNADGTWPRRLATGGDNIKCPRYHSGSRMIYYLNLSNDAQRCELWKSDLQGKKRIVVAGSRLFEDPLHWNGAAAAARRPD